MSAEDNVIQEDLSVSDQTGRESVVILLCAATLLALPYVFFTSFNHLSEFDDEGTLMVGFRSLIEGHRMYDEIYSLYGPLYNGVYSIIYKVLHVPLTHTAGRLIAATLWLSYTGVFALVSFRMTGSRTVTLICYTLTLFWLSELMNSPGHPEELCLLLMALLLLAVYSIGRAPTLRAVAAAGGLVAGLALVKFNVGVFAGGCLLLVLLLLSIQNVWIKIAIYVVTAGLLVMPLVLSALLFDLDWVRSYAAFSTLTIGATLIVQLGLPQPMLLRRAHWIALVSGSSFVCVVVVGCTVLAGSSLRAIFGAVILQNASFIRNWYIPLSVGPVGLLSATISVVFAIICRWGALGTKNPRRLECGVLVLKSMFVLLWIVMSASPTLVLLTLVPFCWLLLLAPPHASPEVKTLREIMGLLGAVLSFYPYPVAGHQIDTGTLISVVALPVLAHDVLVALHARGIDLFRKGKTGFVLAAVTMLALLVQVTGWSGRAYQEGTPLDLPGTEMIRLPPQQAATLRWVTEQLMACSSSYSMPGLLSFAFWTGHALPTPMNVNHVLGFIRPDQQEVIIQALRESPDLCIVYNAKLLQFLDRGQLATNPPLLRYIQHDFTQIDRRQDYAIMTRTAVAR